MPARITIVVHWPGAPAEQVEEISTIVRQMTRQLSDVEECVVVAGDAAGLFEGRVEADADAARRELFGDADFEEIYYAHDVVGQFYQALATAFPRARRICYGDGLGIVYQRDYHLSLLQELGEEPGSHWWGNSSRGCAITWAFQRLDGFLRANSGPMPRR